MWMHDTSLWSSAAYMGVLQEVQDAIVQLEADEIPARNEVLDAERSKRLRTENSFVDQKRVLSRDLEDRPPPSYSIPDVSPFRDIFWPCAVGCCCVMQHGPL